MIEEAIEAMFRTEAVPVALARSSIPGMKARQVWYIDLTFRSKEKSQSRSVTSRIVPFAT